MRKVIKVTRNRERFGRGSGTYYLYNVLASTNVLIPHGLEKAINIKLLSLRLERPSEIYPHLIPIVQINRSSWTARTIRLSVINKLKASTRRYSCRLPAKVGHSGQGDLASAAAVVLI